LGFGNLLEIGAWKLKISIKDALWLVFLCQLNCAYKAHFKSTFFSPNYLIFDILSLIWLQVGVPPRG
jgi:hypothetical protein